LKKKLFFLFLLFFSIVRADVFLLGPGGNGGTPSPGNALNPLDLWSEPIIINGLDCKLKVSLIPTNLVDSFRLLRKFYPEGKFTYNNEAILFEVKEGDLKRRLYLIRTDNPQYPLLQFSIEFKEIPKDFKWPSSLPSAPDMKPIHVMQFPQRNSVYGCFESSFPAKTVLLSLHSSLIADGWQPLTGEAAKAHIGKAKGEFYMKSNPTEIITISTLDKENGSSEAIIYRKKINEVR